MFEKTKNILKRGWGWPIKNIKQMFQNYHCPQMFQAFQIIVPICVDLRVLPISTSFTHFSSLNEGGKSFANPKAVPEKAKTVPKKFSQLYGF